MFNSQSVVYIFVNYIFVAEKWIQSVQQMAKRTPINAFSAVKKCKSKKLTIASSKTMKTKSENNRKWENLLIDHNLECNYNFSLILFLVSLEWSQWNVFWT